MDVRSIPGKCLPLVFAGLSLDVVGLTLLLVGVFADVRAADGQFYGDFLIFTGALIIFISLGFWVMWYAGNARVTPDDGRDTRRAAGLAERLVRKLTERLSRKMASTTGASTAIDARSHDGELAGDTRPNRASRVTWGKATADKEMDLQNYNNNLGYRRENYNTGDDRERYHEGYDNEAYTKENYDGQDGHDKQEKYGNKEVYNHENYKEEGYDNEGCDEVVDSDNKDEGEQL
ncbi:transmembrane protein 238-like [Phycodurus eques]|uniref:transmembrane protein 238-like n=1 Tax=Phycodurus eques TaxID=693459 RepID=UPI002ACE531A|nr:transmembrane protein 238-like [Phycodurus eques]XP_061557306.1 transmembrane protein 238-like [Phycodurus eques]XP_061557307.1 transmembrane protein 238-like [Phycodurus eques]